MKSERSRTKSRMARARALARAARQHERDDMRLLAFGVLGAGPMFGVEPQAARRAVSNSREVKGAH